MNPTALLVLDVVTILSAGLLIGNEVAVSAFVNPVLWALEEDVQARLTRTFAALLGRVMPFWYGATALLLVAEAVVRWATPSRVLLVAAAALWIGVIVFTVAVLVPINDRLAKDTAGEGKGRRDQHHAWDGLHRLRVALLVVALVCFLVGTR